MTGDAGGELRERGRWYMAGEKRQESVEMSCLFCWEFSLRGILKRGFSISLTHISHFMWFQLPSPSLCFHGSMFDTIFCDWLNMHLMLKASTPPYVAIFLETSLSTNGIHCCETLYQLPVSKIQNSNSVTLKCYKSVQVSYFYNILM